MTAPHRKLDLARGSEDDRRWFAAHHGRNYRIRKPIGDERRFAPKQRGFAPWVLVRQLVPGERGRIPFSWRIGEPLLNSEAWGERLFEALVKGRDVTILDYGGRR